MNGFWWKLWSETKRHFFMNHGVYFRSLVWKSTKLHSTVLFVWPIYGNHSRFGKLTEFLHGTDVKELIKHLFASVLIELNQVLYLAFEWFKTNIYKWSAGEILLIFIKWYQLMIAVMLTVVIVCLQVLLMDDFIDKILADISDIGDVEEVSLAMFYQFLRHLLLSEFLLCEWYVGGIAKK